MLNNGHDSRPPSRHVWWWCPCMAARCKKCYARASGLYNIAWTAFYYPWAIVCHPGLADTQGCTSHLECACSQQDEGPERTPDSVKVLSPSMRCHGGSRRQGVQHHPQATGVPPGILCAALACSPLLQPHSRSDVLALQRTVVFLMASGCTKALVKRRCQYLHHQKADSIRAEQATQIMHVFTVYPKP